MPGQSARLALAATFAFLSSFGVLAVKDASARSLAALEARGIVRLCAHPNALPVASKSSERRGYEIELADALVKKLGLALDVEWIVNRYQRKRAGCDIIMGALVIETGSADERLRVSVPYQRSGVALELGPNVPPSTTVSGYEDLSALALKVGVISGSVAAWYLGTREVQTRPFGFEDDMVQALVEGVIDVAAITPEAAEWSAHKLGAPISIVYAYNDEPQLRWGKAVGLLKADDALVEAFNNAIAQLLDDGSIKAILATYGILHRPPQ